MTKDNVIRRLNPRLRSVFLACCVCPTLWSTAASADASAGDPSLDRLGVLQAIGPHPSLANQADLFARLIGAWDVEYTDYSKSGKITHRSGQFIVGWVLDGRAIQDVWIVDRSGTGTEREVYSDICYFDAKSGVWHATFIDPQSASTAALSGTASEDRIVFTTKDFPGLLTRWSFDDVRVDSLVFHDEASGDDGKTWRLQAEYHMKRHSATATAP